MSQLDSDPAALRQGQSFAGRPRVPRGRGAIEFVGLSKSYRGTGGRKFVIRDSTALFPAGRKVALLGRNGAGKSTLLRMISGAQDYDAGEIRRYGSISWPIGFAGSFHPDLTGAQNTRFVARVHGVDTESMVAFVHEFTELGNKFFEPFRTFSSGMRARLAFGVSMGVPFDCYLIDEVTSVGDQSFRERCAQTFQTRLRDASCILATHSLAQARRICDMGAVLDNGTLTLYESVSDAIAAHRRNLGGAEADAALDEFEDDDE